jgi:hypothetical protein
VRVTGIGIGFIDVPQEFTEEFNRWYDLDHVPENLALPEVTGARRYVATPECKAGRKMVRMPELADGAGTYCTVYLFGEEDLGKAAASWHALGAEMRSQRRMYPKGRVPYSGIYRTQMVHARPDIAVAPEAIPFLGHTGILVVFTQVPHEHREAVDKWYDEIHGPDSLEMPGFLASIRFSRVEEPDQGNFLSIFLLEGDPAHATREIDKKWDDWITRGRLPAPHNGSRGRFVGAYRAVTPFEYAFQVE